MASSTAGVGQRLRPGQSRDLPRSSPPRFIVSVSSIQTLSGHRHVRCRRSRIPALGARSRHPHDVPALPIWRDGEVRGRADRHHGAIGATTSSPSCSAARLVRRGADGGRPAIVTSERSGARTDVPHQHRRASRSGPSPDRWWCRCVPTSRRMRSRACRSPRAFLRARRTGSSRASASNPVCRTSPSRLWRSGVDDVRVAYDELSARVSGCRRIRHQHESGAVPCIAIRTSPTAINRLGG